MIYVGPISSIFDIITYLVMWYVFQLQQPRTSDTVSDRMVCGRFVITDIDCPHDTYPQDTVHTKPCHMACDGTDLLNHGNRYSYSFHRFGRSIGLTALPLSLFPRWLGFCSLLHFDADREELVY